VVGLFADDLDRVLVGADRAVRAEPEENRARARLGVDVEVRIERKRAVGHVVRDADREVVARALGAQLGEDGRDHRRVELLRGETVAAAYDDRVGARSAGLAQGGHNVHIKRLAGGAGLLGAVEDGEGAHSLRQRLDEGLDGEGAEEAHFEQAHLLAAGDEPLDRFVRDLGTRAHDHEDALGIGVANVVEEPVTPPGALGETGHDALDDRGAGVIEAIHGFACLEEGVRVGGGAAQNRAVGRQCAPAVIIEQVLGDYEAEIVVREEGNLALLVRGAEAVEEMEEGHA